MSPKTGLAMLGNGRKDRKRFGQICPRGLGEVREKINGSSAHVRMGCSWHGSSGARTSSGSLTGDRDGRTLFYFLRGFEHAAPKLLFFFDHLPFFNWMLHFWAIGSVRGLIWTTLSRGSLHVSHFPKHQDTQVSNTRSHSNTRLIFTCGLGAMLWFWYHNIFSVSHQKFFWEITEMKWE